MPYWLKGITSTWKETHIGLTKKFVWVFPYHVMEISEFLILISYFTCNLVTLKLVCTSFCLLKIQSILFHICGMFCDTFLFCSNIISSFILLSMCWEVTPFLFPKYITWHLIDLLIKCVCIKVYAIIKMQVRENILCPTKVSL